MDALGIEKKISTELRSLGLRESGVVLVHSSLGSLGQVPGGPETVIRGLWDALGPEGTLLMPALSYETVNADNPVFDVVRTPSNVGRIPEYFRTRAGSIRSINPTHSVSGIGPQAELLLNKHILDESPCGPNSPYRLLSGFKGQILFIGCGLCPNTSMHGVEELVNPPYLFGSMNTYKIIFPDGKETQIKCKRHNFKGYRQRYDRIESLLPKEGLKTGQVLNAKVQILESKIMWEKGYEAISKDPLYFVEKIE